MTPEELKAAKEAFVSGFSGTTMAEVATAVMVLPVSLLLMRMILVAHHVAAGSSARLPTTLLFVIEFAVLVVPTILAFTLTWLSPFIITSFLGSCVVLELIFRVRAGTSALFVPFLSSNKDGFLLLRLHKEGEKSAHLPFVTNYRAGMIVCTAIAILAVDFTIFPRRFVKCEMFGVSLMDAGVGSFVLASAIVSRQARRKPGSATGWRSVLLTVKAVSPMLVLGFVRFGVNKAVSYQEHVTEYGVHWNFFFTIACVAMMASVIELFLSAVFRNQLPPTWAYIALAVCYAGGYQYALSYGGLQTYILEAPRVDLVSKNREGLFGVLGFLSIYLGGVALGRLLQAAKKTISDWNRMFIVMLGLSVAMWALAVICDASIAQVSRRMTNMSYAVWILAYNIVQLTALVAVEMCFCAPFLPCESLIMNAVNQNGLATFLIANVLTGLTNLSMQTLFQSPQVAFAVVIAYMFAVCGISVALAVRGIRIKYW